MPEDDRPSGVDPLRPLAPPTWRERVEDVAQLVRTPGRALAFGLLLVGAAVAAFAILRPAPLGPAPELSLPMASSPSSSSAGAPTSTELSMLVVHAAGAVNAPGLYRVASGARVDDLITAAGGLAGDADGDRINLAAPLVDGERVYIPRIGEAVPPAEGPATAPGGSASSGPIDINTATVDELDSLPGIGPSIAQAIVDERERNGPFRSVDDLERVRGIGPSKLDQIRDLVTV